MSKNDVFRPLTIDMGTSGWKIFFGNQSLFIPSLIAKGPIRETVNGLFAADYSKNSIDNIEVETSFGPRLVGNLAKRSQSPAWSSYNIERYGHAEFMESMTLAALSEAGVNGNMIVLNTAVPPEWYGQTIYQDGEDIPLASVITNHFQPKNDFLIRRAGKRGEKQVGIYSVGIWTETKGLLYSFLLDKNGQPTIDYRDLRILVIDIGELTTCMDMFCNLEREKDSLSLTDVSMGSIHKATAAHIKADTRRTIEPWQIRDIVHNGGAIMVSGKRGPERLDIMPYCNEAVTASKNVLRSHVGNFAPNLADVHCILIGGGGSEPLGPAIAGQFRDTKILGRFATGQGLHNLGVMQCRELNG